MMVNVSGAQTACCNESHSSNTVTSSTMSILKRRPDGACLWHHSRITTQKFTEEQLNSTKLSRKRVGLVSKRKTPQKTCHNPFWVIVVRMKRPQAWILPIFTSIHELQCRQENSLIIDGDAKAHDGGAAAR